MDIKKNLSLILGISIPILMIVFIALSIYIPQFFVKPQYDFLYLTGNNNCYYPQDNNMVQIYSVQNSKITKNDQTNSPCATSVSQLKVFYYNVKNNQSNEISFDDAKNLNLDKSLKSPDGFEIISGSSNGESGFFPFYYSGSDYYSKYISGHNFSKKINTQQEGYYDFTFLGWVKK